jgi:hypothetical protein
MTIEWNRALLTLGVAAALAMPSAALARNGSGSHSGEDQTQSGTTHEVSGDAQQGAENEAEQHDTTGTEVPDASGPEQEQQQERTHHSAPAAGGPVRTERYELRGSVVAVDAGAGTVTVAVKKANHGRRGARLRQQTVQFDVSSARIVVRDVNHDGTRDLNDVAEGDAVRVQANLPRTGSLDLTQPIAARQLQDRGSR